MMKYLLSVLIGVFLLSTNNVQAQLWQDENAPEIISSSIETINGQTAFVYVTRLPFCFRLKIEAVERWETTFTQVITQYPSNEICPPCLDCFSLQTNTTLLGTLEGGDYQLDLFFRPDEFTAPTTLSVLGQQLFTVGKKRQQSTQVSSGSIQFQVLGEPNERYIVQSSSDLVAWIPVRTNTGPFTFTANVNATNAFFRTVMHQNTEQ